MRNFLKRLNISENWRNVLRVPEIFRCLADVREGFFTIIVFLGIARWDYPRVIQSYRRGPIEVFSWDDLTTVWAVWFGGEYTLHARDQIIIDLGANIGAFSALAAAGSPGRRILAVEPFPETCCRLRGNMRLGGIEGQVTIVEAAVDATSRTVWMSASANIPSHSRTVDAAPPVGAGLPVTTVTIAELIELAGGAVDFLKMDIEGGESALLEGTAPAVLQKIRRIGLEYHGEEARERTSQAMDAAGFKCTRHHPQNGRGILEYVRGA